MTETFSSKILNQIAEVLKSEFYENEIVFDEPDTQAQKEIFSVMLQKADMQGMNLAQHRRSSLFLIKYFPAGGLKQCCTVADKLFKLLKYLDLPENGRLLATAMEMEMSDGLLHFKVQYNYSLAYKAQETQMAEIETTQGGIYG